MFGHLNHGKPPLEVSQVTGEMSDIVSFGCAAAVTAGDWVQLNTGAAGEDRVRQVIPGTATGAVIGVALETVTAATVAAGGALVRVCVAGYCENAKSANGIALGAAFVSAAGESIAAAATGSLTPLLGVALELSAGLTVDCYIFRQL
tara:strand:- start:4614 stop:5054 length:441 start_codon:yes stop_codon:yes gene_type:complete